MSKKLKFRKAIKWAAVSVCAMIVAAFLFLMLYAVPVPPQAFILIILLVAFPAYNFPAGLVLTNTQAARDTRSQCYNIFRS
jgi:hypothetical protein